MRHMVIKHDFLNPVFLKKDPSKHCGAFWYKKAVSDLILEALTPAASCSKTRSELSKRGRFRG